MAISNNQFRITHLLLLTILLGFYFSVLRDQTSEVVLGFSFGCVLAYICGAAIFVWLQHYSKIARAQGRGPLAGYLLATFNWVSVVMFGVVLILHFLLAAVFRFCTNAAFEIPVWSMLLTWPIGFVLSLRLLGRAKAA